MEKEFVPYQESFELKELGFDEPCFAIYVDTQLQINATYQNHLEYKGWVAAPVYQQAFRWFREKHELISEIIWMSALPTHNTFSSRIKSIEKTESMSEYNTYEEAELACLKKLIEILKKKP